MPFYPAANDRVQPAPVPGTFLGGNNPAYDQIAAAALVAILPPLILALCIQRYLVRGLSFGAVKG